MTPTAAPSARHHATGSARLARSFFPFTIRLIAAAVLAAAVLAAAGNAAAQVTWTARDSNRDWVAVASSADGTKLVAVDNDQTANANAGAGGRLYTSTDSGATWTPRTGAGLHNWTGVASSSDGVKLAAVVSTGGLYTSADSGATWTLRTNAGTSRNWSSIASSSDGTKLLAAESYGKLYTSTDSGATWTPRETDRPWQAVASSADGTKLVAVDNSGTDLNGGKIYTSTDSGATWTPRDSFRAWSAVASSSDGTKLVATVYEGGIYTSADSGQTWTPHPATSLRNWCGVASSADGQKLVAVDGWFYNTGFIYTSTDAGATWTPQESSRNWFSVASSSDGNKLVAGVFGGGKLYSGVGAPANSAPTDLVLSATSIAENVAANSTVGTLSSTDPDAGNTFTYTLVTGTGSTDNASFTLTGSSLTINASPNFEAKASYAIRVRTTDQGGLFFEKQFTIAITNVNETPTDLALSAATIAENVAANTTVGTLSTTDPDAGNTFTYTLVTGTGSTDNGSFTLTGSSLAINASPNFEAKASYAIRVRTTDQGGLFFEKQFTIAITNINETPTDIALSASSIAENNAAGATVGTLSATDPDAGQTHSFSLVAGTGSTDNGSFTITGNALTINAITDFETKSSYAIRVRATDNGSPVQNFEREFTIAITDVAEAPNQPPTFTFQAVPLRMSAWGKSNLGQLGTGTTSNQFSPVPVGTDGSWESLDCGQFHTVAVKRNGELWAWGHNYSGQLGIGPRGLQTSPVRIGTATDWQSVACGDRHTVAIKKNGELWAWGADDAGQLGNGPAGAQSSPVRIGTATDWQSVACGDYHSVAVKKNGELWAWGEGRRGLLGNGTAGDQTSPVRIGTATDWQSVACGNLHTVAIKKNGELWAWGSNSGGQLGIGSARSQTSPVRIGTATDWQSVACGGHHTVAVKKNGELWAWGSDRYGQLGNGPAGDQTSPVRIGTATDWQSVDCGENHTVAVKKNGELWAWGEGDYGRLGNGAAGDQSSPVEIGAGTQWQSVACGGYHTVALPRPNDVYWAKNGGLRTMTAFAGDISPGPASESGQTVSFTVTNSNNALFSAQPALAPNGTLTFTPATNATGSAVVTVVAQDNGGTTGGGQDTSPPQTFEISIVDAVLASSVTPGSTPVNLAGKTFINDTGAPITISNPLILGGDSSIVTYGPKVTFTGTTTLASETHLTVVGTASITSPTASVPTRVEVIGGGVLEVTPPVGASASADVTISGPLDNLFRMMTTIQIQGIIANLLQQYPNLIIELGSNQELKGSAIAKIITFLKGSVNNCAASPGKLGAVTGTWEAGSTYRWEISKADGTAGADPGWDMMDYSGVLTLAPVPNQKIWISLHSLTTANVTGPMANFNNQVPYAWKIASAAGGISGFSPDLFALDATGIENDIGGGSFGIELQNAGKDLVVTYTPALRTASWTGDATSGIDATRGTLWARRFGTATGATINGVALTGTGFTVSSPEFDLTGPTANYNIDDANNLTPLTGQGSAEVAKRFVYGGNPATLTFKQLTPGYTYTASIFTVGFDATPGVRLQTFASGTDSRVLDPNVYGDNAGNRIDYSFTADAATRAMTITPSNPANTFCLYGVALRLDTLLPPAVSGAALTAFTGTDGTLNATVTSDARSPFLRRGFVIAPTASNPAPELFGTGVTDFPVAGTTGAFSQAITGLVAGTQYSFAAYAENEEGLSYSSVVTFTTPSPVPLPSGAVSWYQAENNAQDSVGANHATASATTYPAGRKGLGFSLTGSAGSYLNCTNNPSLKLTTGTVEAWIKTSNAGSSYRGIIVKQFAYGLFLENNILIGYDWGGGGSLVSNVNLADNGWHHVALTFTANSMKLYADGVEVASRASFAVSNQNSALVLGAGDATGITQNFAGLIDEATIYNRVLSAAEIQSISNAGAQGKIAVGPLVAPSDFAVTRNGANLDFNFTSVIGRTYTLWQSDTLAPGSWTNTGQSPVFGNGAAKSFTVPAPNPATVPKRFYRMQVE